MHSIQCTATPNEQDAYLCHHANDGDGEKSGGPFLCNIFDVLTKFACAYIKWNVFKSNWFDMVKPNSASASLLIYTDSNESFTIQP